MYLHPAPPPTPTLPEHTFLAVMQPAPKANSRQADASLKKQTQMWTKKAPANARKPVGEKVVGAVTDKRGLGVPGMGMSWFDQDDIFGFGPEQ